MIARRYESYLLRLWESDEPVNLSGALRSSQPTQVSAVVRRPGQPVRLSRCVRQSLPPDDAKGLTKPSGNI